MDKQDDRMIAEAKQDKLRYLEEVHSAQRKMNDLQAHLKLLESKLADKDVEIRLLQEKKSSLLSHDCFYPLLMINCFVFFPFSLSPSLSFSKCYSLWIIL